MAVWLRNAIYLTLLVLLLPYLLVRKPGYRRGWQQRFFGLSRGEVRDLSSTGKVIWLHGVSVGEVRLLLAMYRELSNSAPDARFAVSATTDSGLGLARELFPSNVLVFRFPLDFSWACKRTWNTLKPSMLVLAELELWPNLLAVAEKEQTPVVVINGRLSLRSCRGYRRFSWLTTGMFARLSLVAAQSPEYAERFVACGTAVSKVVVTGSIKFDNVQFDRSAPAVTTLKRLANISSQHRVFVAGSTQAEEELACIEAFRTLTGRAPALRLLIVPRHPQRFDTVAKMLKDSGLDFVRRSSLSPDGITQPWQVMLVDTIGELANWWGVADMAMVGGSFGKRGGQNMLEPAAFGANVAFGPKTSNFRDIAELLIANRAATRLQSLSEILPWLEQHLVQNPTSAQQASNARQLVAAQQGALKRTTSQLQDLLHASPKPNRDTRAA
ncbi:MAG: 3-deoxy-D-manno-octulosonic acid transferase [Planctomycetales bacterium]|nr:3-deoxy-D-manno-octulosonic acid transferase [Planctomycetales bacterium]